MPAELFEKLVGHLAVGDRYPPLIVRPLASATGDRAYQVLDGHHRLAALRRLGRSRARCVIWTVDDHEALRLLATLNRLEGRDDPTKRGRLLTELIAATGCDPAALSAALPESTRRVEQLLALASPPPRPRPPRRLDDMPVAVHFFLLPAQRTALEARLRAIGGAREEALMRLVKAAGA